MPQWNPARSPDFKRLFRSTMKTLMSSVLSISTGGMPASRHSTPMTGITVRGLSLRARAQSSRTSMFFGILPVRRECARCQAWLRGSLHCFRSPIKRAGYAPCAQGRLATVANTRGHEIIDQLHHQVQGWRDLLSSGLVLQVIP